LSGIFIYNAIEMTSLCTIVAAISTYISWCNTSVLVRRNEHKRNSKVKKSLRFAVLVMLNWSI